MWAGNSSKPFLCPSKFFNLPSLEPFEGGLEANGHEVSVPKYSSVKNTELDVQQSVPHLGRSSLKFA